MTKPLPFTILAERRDFRVALGTAQRSLLVNKLVGWIYLLIAERSRGSRRPIIKKNCLNKESCTRSWFSITQDLVCSAKIT